MKEKRQLEDSEEVRKVIAELQSKINEEGNLSGLENDDSEAMSYAEALASEELAEESYFAPEYDTEQQNEDYEEPVYEEQPMNNEESAREVRKEEPQKPKNKTKKKKRKKSDGEDVIISMENVTMSYVKGVPALNDVSLSVRKGEFVFIVGESGSGKSTLIRLLLRELQPTEGKITVNGFKVDKLKRRHIPKLRRNMGVVFQNFRLLKDRSVYENVAFAQRIIQVPAREMKKNVPAMLAEVGLASKYRAFPNELSGGEQQRVALARALVNRPPILLADEPTGNLDPKTTIEIMNLLEKINEKGTTVLVVTHNDKIVNDMKKRVVTIKNGIIISDEEKGGYIDED